ncbi:MAG: hypothetical protein AAGC60_08075 [Acidobacteriota bacterium]
MNVDSAERERYRALLREGPSRDGEPVAPDLIWRAAAGELDPQQTDALLERSLRDPEVALAWQMAVELHDEMSVADARMSEATDRGTSEARPELDNVVPLRPPRTPVQRAAPWALAAGLTLALGAIFFFGPESVPEGPDTLRSADAPVARIAATSDATLPRDAFVLAWSLPESVDAARYRLWLTTEELAPLAELRDLDGAEVRIEAATFDGLADGTRLLWRVEAQAGGERIESETFVVTLGPARGD